MVVGVDASDLARKSSRAGTFGCVATFRAGLSVESPSNLPQYFPTTMLVEEVCGGHRPTAVQQERREQQVRPWRFPAFLEMWLVCLFASDGGNGNRCWSVGSPSIVTLSRLAVSMCVRGLTFADLLCLVALHLISCYTSSTVVRALAIDHDG